MKIIIKTLLVFLFIAFISCSRDESNLRQQWADKFANFSKKVKDTASDAYNFYKDTWKEEWNEMFDFVSEQLRDAKALSEKKLGELKELKLTPKDYEFFKNRILWEYEITKEGLKKDFESAKTFLSSKYESVKQSLFGN